MLATVSPLVPIKPAPRVPTHATDVAVVQLDVAQSASATTAVTVPSLGAKLVPVSVTLATPDPALYGEATVTTGATGHSKRVNAKNKKRQHWLLAHSEQDHHT